MDLVSFPTTTVDLCDDNMSCSDLLRIPPFHPAFGTHQLDGTTTTPTLTLQLKDPDFVRLLEELTLLWKGGRLLVPPPMKTMSSGLAAVQAVKEWADIRDVMDGFGTPSVSASLLPYADCLHTYICRGRCPVVPVGTSFEEHCVIQNTRQWLGSTAPDELNVLLITAWKLYRVLFEAQLEWKVFAKKAANRYQCDRWMRFLMNPFSANPEPPMSRRMQQLAKNGLAPRDMEERKKPPKLDRPPVHGLNFEWVQNVTGRSRRPNRGRARSTTCSCTGPHGAPPVLESHSEHNTDNAQLPPYASAGYEWVLQPRTEVTTSITDPASVDPVMYA
ncbi:hypothetical protein T439DRAFT_384343 [Meredithblackwellia eburnea MCA 4105]